MDEQILLAWENLAALHLRDYGAVGALARALQTLIEAYRAGQPVKGWSATDNVTVERSTTADYDG